MNLRERIEAWEKFKIQPLKYIEAVNPTNFEQTVDSFIQALKEAAGIMDKIGLEENEVNATLVKPTESDIEQKILNAYLKDFWSAPRRWLKKWGFEE
jgi:hypothetical protein